jgi:hypothetical protein
MYYISLDTNAWIYLANGMEPVKLLHYIEAQVAKGNITLIVPELTIEEWQRNKSGIKVGVLKELNSATDHFKRITRAITQRTADAFEFLFTSMDLARIEEDYFDNITKNILSNKAKLEEVIDQNILSVEKLFQHENTVRLPTTDLSKLQSSELALQKKAPFIKKNSFADAVILMTFCNYLKERAIESGIFISYNSEDYCLKENGHKILHPDLQPFLDEIKAKFYTVIGEAINTIEKVLTNEELARIKEVQEEWDDHYCEVCEENRRHSELFFSEPFAIDNENDIPEAVDYDTEIPFVDAEKIAAKPNDLVKTIQMAQCSYCGTEHYLCQKCGSVNCLWDSMYNTRIECAGCGSPYYFDQKYDYRDGGALEIRVPADKKICQGCNNDFDKLSDSGLCSECEEKYGTEG